MSNVIGCFCCRVTGTSHTEQSQRPGEKGGAGRRQVRSPDGGVSWAQLQLRPPPPLSSARLPPLSALGSVLPDLERSSQPGSDRPGYLSGRVLPLPQPPPPADACWLPLPPARPQKRPFPLESPLRDFWSADSRPAPWLRGPLLLGSEPSPACPPPTTPLPRPGVRSAFSLSTCRESFSSTTRLSRSRSTFTFRFCNLWCKEKLPVATEGRVHRAGPNVDLTVQFAPALGCGAPARVPAPLPRRPPALVITALGSAHSC